MSAPALNAAHEVFRIAQCSVDVAEVQRLLERGEIHPEPGSVIITAWAQQILGLDRNQPDARPIAMWHEIDHDHVGRLPPSRLKDPIFVAATRIGTIIFDGSHRVARAYLDGKDELPALYFTGDLAERIVRYEQVPQPRAHNRLKR